MTDQYRITDKDGDRLTLLALADGLYVNTRMGTDEPSTAGPFTRAQLVEALDAVAPAGNSTGPHVHHEAPSGDYQQGGPVPIPESFRGVMAEASEHLRLGRLVKNAQDDGTTVQVGRAKITPCDTRGRTREEVTLQLALDAARAGRGKARDERDELREKLTAAEQDRTTATAALEQMARDFDTLRAQRDAAVKECDTIRGERDGARARAEKAEKERDEARGALRARLGVPAESRPLTPHEVPSETVERARAAWINAGGRVYPGVTFDLRHALAAVLPVAPDAMTAREHLNAAWDAAHVPADGTIPAGAKYITRNHAGGMRGPFTEGEAVPDTDPTGSVSRRLLDPPARAKGAEEIEALVDAWKLHAVPRPTLPYFLAEHGVRVVGEDGAA